MVRIAGVRRRGVLCIDCLCGALPFIWIPGEGDYRRAQQEYRGGPTLGAANLEGGRFDPFDDDVKAILGREYTGYGDLAGCQQEDLTRGAVLWPWLSITYGVRRVGTWRCWRQS